MTGFESTILGIIIITALIAFLWRALGRLHVTVNNNNSPQAVVATGSEIPSRSKSILGWLVLIGIVVAVAVIVVAAFDLHQAAATPTVIAVPKIASTSVAVPVTGDDYVPVALPIVQTGFDLTPLFALAAISIVTLFISRRTSHVAKLNTFTPKSIADAPIPISADRPLQEVMDKNQP